MPVRMFAPPRRSARRPGARSTGLGLAAALLVTQVTLVGAWAGSTDHEGLIVYSSVARNGPGAELGHSDLFITSAHSNSDRRLTSTPEDEGTPSWSPDGSRIAFSRHMQDANGISLGMWLYSIDPATGTETLLTKAGSFIWPSWSPDGSQLVFSGHDFAGPDDLSQNIFVMPSNGGEIRQLTFGPFADASPVWSPDGERIAFSSNRSGPGSQIWLMNADGSDQHVIETALSYAQAADWSPDGQWLAVVGVLTSPSDPDLFKVRPDGTDLTQLTSMPTAGKEDPTWSPDGTLVLFNAYEGRGSRGARSSELMVVPAGGGTAELFGPGVRHLLGQLTPDWTP